MRRQPQKVVNGSPKPAAEDWDRATIKSAALFVTFLQVGQHDRRRKEFLVDNRDLGAAYREALGEANRLQEWANASEISRRPIIYAVDKAGRQALVTSRDAQALGLLP